MDQESKIIEGDEAKQRVWEMIKGIKYALMTSYDERGGRLKARPMMAVNLKEFTGTLWFFTASDSEKTNQLRENCISMLSYAEPSRNDYVAISGQATVVRDQAKIDEYWNEFVHAWFPEGKEDPNLTLIKFEAEEAEFWDSPASAVATAYAYIKARMTGEKPQAGDTGKATYKKAGKKAG